MQSARHIEAHAMLGWFEAVLLQRLVGENKKESVSLDAEQEERESPPLGSRNMLQGYLRFLAGTYCTHLASSLFFLPCLSAPPFRSKTEVVPLIARTLSLSSLPPIPSVSPYSTRQQHLSF
eukprot:Sspe_Gene.41079::Locus_19858_Transcript_1_1_Confidence_1.000_Length_950::g.41079::m.41079